LLGYDFPSVINNTQIFLGNCDKLLIKKGIYDEIFLEQYPNVNETFTIDKPVGWNYRTVLDAKFLGNLEAGSVGGNGMQITGIRFQKRKSSELIWHDVAEIPYNSEEQLLYTAQDKAIQCGETYQYSLIPLVSVLQGDRVLSDDITADFEGVYLSDKDHNYRLFYNIEYGEIEHNNPSSTLEPLNSRYPIVTYGQLDYRKSSLTALFLSKVTEDNDYGISVINEQKERKELLAFVKNHKPKIFRSETGDLILVTITDNPKEVPNNEVKGISKIQFNYIEVGDADNSEDLRNNDLLQGLEAW
jgi:hypothetical protein